MPNFNIEIDLLKLNGAKVADVQGNTEVRRCICIPIDNHEGTITDAYFTRGEDSGELLEVKKKGVMLSLTAFELKKGENGQSHLIKPSLSREVTDRMDEGSRRRSPWIGNLQPWKNPAGGSGADW